MRRPSLFVTTLVAACNLYEPSLLTGDPGAAGGAGLPPIGGASSAGAGGAGGSELGASGAGDGSGGLSSGGTGGDVPGGMAGEAGADAEGGAGGEESAGTSGSSGAGAGSGGATSGAGGAAGKAGAGGASAGGGGPGGGGGGGGAESCTGATGCARLSVPLTTSNGRTHFSIALGSEVDFSNAVVTYRVRKVSATGGRIWAYVQHGGTPDHNLIYGGARNFDQLGSDFVTVTWDVAATTPSFPFDKSVIARLGIEIVASGSGPWTNPSVVLLDSIAVTGPAVGPWPFDDASSVWTAASPPSGALWMSDNAPDELLPGSTLSWVP
jgi:hypothetical protein